MLLSRIAAISLPFAYGINPQLRYSASRNQMRAKILTCLKGPNLDAHPSNAGRSHYAGQVLYRYRCPPERPHVFGYPRGAAIPRASSTVYAVNGKGNRAPYTTGCTNKSQRGHTMCGFDFVHREKVQGIFECVQTNEKYGWKWQKVCESG